MTCQPCVLKSRQLRSVEVARHKHIALRWPQYWRHLISRVSGYKPPFCDWFALIRWPHRCARGWKQGTYPVHLSPPAGMCAHQRCTNCAPIGAQPPLAAPICAPHKHRPLAPSISRGSFFGLAFFGCPGKFLNFVDNRRRTLCR